MIKKVRRRLLFAVRATRLTIVFPSPSFSFEPYSSLPLSIPTFSPLWASRSTTPLIGRTRSLRTESAARTKSILSSTSGRGCTLVLVSCSHDRHHLVATLTVPPFRIRSLDCSPDTLLVRLPLPFFPPLPPFLPADRISGPSPLSDASRRRSTSQRPRHHRLVAQRHLLSSAWIPHRSRHGRTVESRNSR